LFQVALNEPSLQSLLKASEYQITFIETIPDLPERIEGIIKSQHLIIQRKGRNFDLRPLLLSIELLPIDSHRLQRVHTLLQTDTSTHARPDELVHAIGIQPEKALFHRLKLHFFTKDILIGH
ncbi:MAG: hypothetical protein N3D16_12890, partial [Anaerolineales bacterium]|nr:hypothetical protein [Anaerolineales bacterium]